MRQDGWFDRLKDVCEGYKTSRWQRSSLDCGTFAADCMLALGCDDLGEGLRGKYGTKIELARLLAAQGHRSVESYVESWCAARNYPDIPPEFCQCGDLGITSTGVVCIRMPKGFLAMGESGGLAHVNPKRAWAIAWE